MPDVRTTELRAAEACVTAPPNPAQALRLAIAGMRKLQERGEGGLWIARGKESEPSRSWRT